MKTNAKKILLSLGVALLGSFAAQAQGLQGIQVEKYYQADANDVANAVANGASPALTTGHVTYRVYVDMAAGYKFNATFGNSFHNWKVTTTTDFYNDPSTAGAYQAATTTTVNFRKNTVGIDSWLGAGPIAVNKMGVPEAEDTDGSIGNAQTILANNPGGIFGLPISTGAASTSSTTVADGLINGTFSAASIVGLFSAGAGTSSAIFDATPGSVFLENNGSVAYLGGIAGSPSTNKVLIGQFTTDGVLGFELNIQITNTTTSVSEIYVASNPQAGETAFAGLTLAPPTVSVTSPLNGANVINGNAVAITASATSVGTITSVEFKVNGVSIGTDLTSPYTASYNALTNGSFTITALATDNNSNTATSSNVVINVAANQAPIVSVLTPTSTLVGNLVTFTASAVDNDGTVASVSFSVDNVAIGTDATSPYTYTWTASPFGNHTIKASAIDNLGLVGLSLPVTINVVANALPTVTITAPTNNSSVIAPQVVTITAAANDADGTISSLQAFVNNVSIGTFTAGAASYTATWTYATSTLTTLDVIKVVAIDNAAGSTTSTPVNVNVANPNALPYVIGVVKEQCNQGNFCLPISAAITYSVNDVVGYDIVLNYDASKVTPTGSVTVVPGVITPSYVTVINTFGGGVMNISAFFNSSAPINAEWNGNGDLFCVGFTKNVMNSVDTAVYSISSLQESYFNGVTPKTVSAGKYITYKDTTFDAKLKFWSNGSPIAYNAGSPSSFLITNIYGTNSVCAVTNTNISVQPNLTGDFTYNILNGTSINISRDVAPLTIVQPVINAADYFIGTQVLLNSTLTIPSVYQIVALDVNLDGVVSAGDITQINQRSVNLITEFRQAWNYNAAGTNTLGVPSKDYVFVDSLTVLNDPAYAISSTYPSNNLIGYSKAKVPFTPFCLPVPQASITVNCPTINDAVYRGVMLGDVNGNVATTTGSLQLRPNGNNKVVIDLANSIINGNSVEVPVTFVSSDVVYGIDLAAKFDESLTFNTLVNYPSTTDALAYFSPVDKTLRLTASSNNLSAYNANQSVLSIRFETKDGKIDENQFNSLVGYLNGEPVSIEVSSKTVGINALSVDNSVSVYPNPTNGILNITSISDATVQLLDISGKEILLQTSVIASKTQQVYVGDFANGVYILKVSNKDFVTIKKVVLSK